MPAGEAPALQISALQFCAISRWNRGKNGSSPHRVSKKHAEHQPENSEDHGREHMGKKMCPKSDAAKPHHHHQQKSAKNAQEPPMARPENGQEKQHKLSIKQSRPNGMAAGET